MVENSNKIVAIPMKKWTKRGAVFGGIWGLLALPIYLILGFIYWERSVPILSEEALSILLFFPSTLIRPLFEIFGFLCRGDWIEWKLGRVKNHDISWPHEMS